MKTGKRTLCAVIGGTLAALLLTAGMLSPNACGYGTHEQLGLPPCTFATLVSLPCPLCGMTTAWSHFMHGHWGSAIQTHATGTVLAILAFGVSLWTLAFAAMGKTFIVPPSERAVLGFALLLLALIVVEWIVRLDGKWIFLVGGP